MSTMTLRELYNAVKAVADSGEDLDRPIMVDDGGDFYTLDGFGYVEGRLIIHISPSTE
jgi:hypothetical protein